MNQHPNFQEGEKQQQTNTSRDQPTPKRKKRRYSCRETTAHERLSDYKENAVKKMTASTIGSGHSGVVAAKKENADEDGNVESLLLKNMAQVSSDDDDEGRKHRQQLLQSDKRREL